MEIVWLVIRYLGGASIALAGAYFDYDYKRKKKEKENNMRLFDEQDNCFQDAYLKCCIRYAKGEIAALNLPSSTDVIALAVQYDVSYFLFPIDFAGQNLENIPAFTGNRPIKRPQ